MQKSFVELLNDFREDRHNLNKYLESLSTEQLQRTGRHPVYGLINVEGWTEFFLLHEAHHFWTIAKLAPQVNNSRIFGKY
jgi:DinB superfamily